MGTSRRRLIDELTLATRAVRDQAQKTYDESGREDKESGKTNPLSGTRWVEGEEPSVAGWDVISAGSTYPSCHVLLRTASPSRASTDSFH